MTYVEPHGVVPSAVVWAYNTLVSRFVQLPLNGFLNNTACLLDLRGHAAVKEYPFVYSLSPNIQVGDVKNHLVYSAAKMSTTMVTLISSVW